MADNDTGTPLAKALAASRATAQRLLCAAAEALHAALPADEVVYRGSVPVHGGRVNTVLTWPGNLMVLDPYGGEILREVPAAELAVRRYVVSHFMAPALRRGRPLLKCRFQPPQGSRLVAVYGADCVLRVHAAASGELRAESEPGKPCELRSGFEALRAHDLSPRFA